MMAIENFRRGRNSGRKDPKRKFTVAQDHKYCCLLVALATPYQNDKLVAHNYIPEFK